MTTARTAPSTTIANGVAKGYAIRWINRGLEFLWLLVLVAVPLAFVDRESFLSELELAYVDVPKTVLLRTLVGLMAALWLLELALHCRFQIGYPYTIRRQRLRPETWLRKPKGWPRMEPARWVTLAVVLYLGSTLLSTALSESFSVSMWGLVPGQDTYPAYTITSYVVLFGVVATHLRSKAQLERLLWAIALMGVLVGGYAWMQFYEHDVFNLREVPGDPRSGSTLGNSILAGSLLLMSITVSLAAATIRLGQPLRSRRFWGELCLWTLILTIQLTALIFSGSRGPWVGSIAGLVLLLGLVAVFAGWRSLGRMGLVLGLAGGLTAAAVLSPPPIPQGEPTRAPTSRGGYYEIPPPVQGLDPTGRALSIGREVGGGGLSSRIGIWETSGRILARGPWFESETPRFPILRLWVGYGPDMFKYAYLLERLPSGPDRVLTSERFAHNLLIHRAVELGLLGLLATLGLFAAPLLVGGYQLFRRHHDNSTFHNLVLAGLLAALAGRFLEQMVGVAAVSDLTIFWVLLALLATQPTVTNASQQVPDPGPSLPHERPSGRFSPRGRIGILGVQTVIPVTVAVCIVAGIGALTWTKSINYLEAGFKARQGLDGIHNGELETALVSLNRAIELAPDVSVYHSVRAAVYQRYQRQDNGARELECANLAQVTPYEKCLLRKIHSSNLQAGEQRPFEWRPRLAAAESAMTLALLENDSARAQEATELFQESVRLDPHSWWKRLKLAAFHLQLEQYELALAPLEKSLAILDGTPKSAFSRQLQGMAYLGLDDPRLAKRSFDEAIRLNPQLKDAYTNRGASYNQLGQYDRAIKDLDKAIELGDIQVRYAPEGNSDSALAYTNRGNAYGNLGHLQKAIKDYSEAIRLNPKFALAYSNRALAYTYLGRDEDAQIDVQRGAELGLDIRPLLALIDQAKNNR